MATRGYEFFDEDSSSLPEFPAYYSLITYTELIVASTLALIFPVTTFAAPILVAKRRVCRSIKGESVARN